MTQTARVRCVSIEFASATRQAALWPFSLNKSEQTLSMSTFEYLIADLTRDVNRAQPRDALQFCANWFNARLQEQRARVRDVFDQGNVSVSAGLPRARGQSAPESLYQVLPGSTQRRPTPDSIGSISPDIHNSVQYPPVPSPTSPRSRLEPTRRPSAGPSPFGTLNIPGNAAMSLPTRLPGNGGIPQSQRTFISIREEDDGSDASSHHSMTLPNPLTKRASTANVNGFFGPPPSALGRRVSVSAESISPSSGPERPPPFFAKSPEQMRRLEDAIRDAFLFRKLDDRKRNAVLGAMKEMHFSSNTCVITQGDDGDYFYVVDSGTLDCYKRTEGDTSPTSSSNTAPDWHPKYGKKVFSYERGGTFGELALMYYAKRAATVITTSPCTLWALDRVTFQTILLDISARTRRSYEAFLASVPFLESLNDGERGKLADVLQPREFADGQDVVREGEVGNEFYIIEEGEAEALKKVRNEHGEIVEEVVKKYKRGDYFGELALLRRAPRAATVRAITSRNHQRLKVAALDADAFTRLLGPLRDLMERSAATLYSTPSSPVASP